MTPAAPSGGIGALRQAELLREVAAVLAGTAARFLARRAREVLGSGVIFDVSAGIR